MNRQAGFSLLEVLLVALTMVLIIAIIYANFRDAVMYERRSLAQQALLTSAGLQERWFVRLYEYARSIEEVGGADSAGEHYELKVTQDPCGDTSCYTIVATVVGEQETDRECEKMTINHLGVRRASNFRNEDTTSECWKSSV